MPEGSPLAVHTMRQAALLQEELGIPVRYAMRYGEPSIKSALAGLQDALVLPLYPQYAESTTESVRDVLPQGTPMVESFHAHPAYLDALASNVRRHWQQHGRSPMLVMSFHGLPQKGAERYELECHATAALLAARLGLKEQAWKATFQSRFGYADWLQPYTQPTLVALAGEGLKRIDVVCPGFVADCLETLEEIGITAHQAFRAAGGQDLCLIPCLNESAEWISALAQIARARVA
jgi:ferrochelatase